ncbi:MAG TPA: CoA transferase [Acidimicrobiia bacterium]|nr:CoA transferase [Acidimicrobiia bacterium]
MTAGGDPLAAWAGSGVMGLTGRAGGPALGPPEGFVERLLALEERLVAEFQRLESTLELDALALLGERAALAGLRRQGDRSCGGAARLLRAGDGWLALSLARPSDVELLPAWLGDALQCVEDPWSAVAPAVADRTVSELVAGAAVLGLPAASLPVGADRPFRSQQDSPGMLPVVCTPFGDAAPAEVRDLLVVDLSSLWAGPLGAQLLGFAGARIVKVESTGRPDGARFGPAAFFDLLHAGHESVALDFTAAEGRRDLRRLLEAADVVIEASRPRALQQLGVDAEALLRNGRPRLWISITGYGRRGDGAQRVAFGDDGAVAGGLVVWDEIGPCFCADAVADPLTGLVAATAALGSVAAGGRWLLDVSLQAVAAYFAADASPAPEPCRTASADGTVQTERGPVTVAPPRARPCRGNAAPLGAHTEAVLSEIRRPRQ